MHYESNRNLVDCAIIKVESKPEYYFKVNTRDIMNASLLIKNIFDEYNIPYSRIYLTGFTLVTKNEIGSLDKLNENILRIVNENMVSNTSVAKR